MKIIIGKKREAHWEIENEIIKVYSKPQIVFGKLKLENEIHLNKIDNIDIYFTSQPMAGAATGYAPFSHTHQIMFNIKMKNNECASFNILTGTNRDELIQAINYLIDQNICFIDQYNLISLINNKDKKIWNGIEEIIKVNKLPYSRHKVS